MASLFLTCLLQVPRQTIRFRQPKVAGNRFEGEMLASVQDLPFTPPRVRNFPTPRLLHYNSGTLRPFNIRMEKRASKACRSCKCSGSVKRNLPYRRRRANYVATKGSHRLLCCFSVCFAHTKILQAPSDLKQYLAARSQYPAIAVGMKLCCIGSVTKTLNFEFAAPLLHALSSAIHLVGIFRFLCASG